MSERTVTDMPGSSSSRRAHRLVAIAFLPVVVASFVSAVLQGPVWIGLLAVPPLLVLIVTGATMLVTTRPPSRVGPDAR